MENLYTCFHYYIQPVIFPLVYSLSALNLISMTNIWELAVVTLVRNVPENESIIDFHSSYLLFYYISPSKEAARHFLRLFCTLIFLSLSWFVKNSIYTSKYLYFIHCYKNPLILFYLFLY